MKKLNLKLINRDAFNSNRSYEAALYAGEVINAMLHASKNGSIILSYKNVIKLDAAIELDESGQFQAIVIKDSAFSKTLIVGDETTDNDKIYCTKRNIREFFKLWRVCRVINVIKATDLA